ncbi:translation elongation factor Ts [Candidatus Schneideria nysicola]|uniref:translation elongation factor Ts n=1 Tax=Candidatus Schneideria nysicola TaxID=1081631 RepID=UPI001CAA6732|nr:elongation factor Ts [Candidatus Schneideria nysicola]
MVSINASLIKELRNRTGIGIIECKKALIESQGDIQIAIDNIRKSNQFKFDKKSYRVVNEGIILIKIDNHNKYGVILEINCETDFVSQSINFKKFGNKIISTALYEKINQLELLQSKFEEEKNLLSAQFGERIDIRRLSILQGNLIGSYIHNNNRIGVILSAKNAEIEFLKHLSMHIAASNPIYINSKDIPKDIIEHEYQIQHDITMQSQSSVKEEVRKKIIEGRMRKFIEEITLTHQKFILNPQKTVGQIIHEKNVEIYHFIRFEIGQYNNIEKDSI